MVERRSVAAHEQVLTVIEGVASMLVNVRAGTSAGFTTGLEDGDIFTAQLRKPNGGRETAYSGTDDGYVGFVQCLVRLRARRDRGTGI